jgi:hypothetical protein
MSLTLKCTPCIFFQILRHRLKSDVILFYILKKILRYRLKDSCIVSLLRYRLKSDVISRYRFALKVERQL